MGSKPLGLIDHFKTLVLDHRLIRENPTLIEEGLARRGMKLNFKTLQNDCKKLRDLEESRNKFQAEGNQIGKEVGNKIKNGINPQSEEIKALRLQGNLIKQKVSLLEEQEKEISDYLSKQILNLPNIPSMDCPDGIDEKDNKEIRRWGEPLEQQWFKNHWEIAYNLKILDTEKSAKISKSRFITLFNEGARLERALINFMLDTHTSNGYKEVLPPVLINSTSLTGS